jgi:membrane protein DedA with SNARE-associated domain
MSAFLNNFIDAASGSALLLPIVIVLCTIIFEDLTSIIVGILAADGLISVPEAMISIYIGIALGDTVLYSLGALARTHPRLAHYVDHDFTASFRLWLENGYSLKIFSGHFVPGFRFTSYVASGFFRFPLSSYVPMAIAGGLILGTVLFSVSYWFGSLTSGWVGHARWGIAIIFILALVFIGRHNLLAYKATKNGKV